MGNLCSGPEDSLDYSAVDRPQFKKSNYDRVKIYNESQDVDVNFDTEDLQLIIKVQIGVRRFLAKRGIKVKAMLRHVLQGGYVEQKHKISETEYDENKDRVVKTWKRLGG